MRHQSCHHTTPTKVHCTLFALFLSTVFVLNLYILLPSRIRQLPRNDTLHIIWRSGGTACTVLLSIVIYPMLFCHSQRQHQSEVDNLSDGSNDAPLWEILGWSHWTLTPLLHAMILYLGPIVASVLRLHIFTVNQILHQKKLSSSSSSSSWWWRSCATWNIYRNEITHRILQKYSPFSLTPLNPRHQKEKEKENPQEEWAKTLRDLLIAPLAEEMIFRSCIVPPFVAYATDTRRLSIGQISWITPLFFGMAHIHHAVRSLYQSPPRRNANQNTNDNKKGNVKLVLLSTTFQFVYTTLFGAYATYSFIKTASIPAAVLFHSFCNWMGIPDVGDILGDIKDLEHALVLDGDGKGGWGMVQWEMREVGVVRWYRGLVAVAYASGIYLFVVGFGAGVWGLFAEGEMLRNIVMRS